MSCLGDISEDSSNICCYFKDENGKSTWQWGLVPGTHAWLSIPGNWEQNERTGVKRFVANSSINEAKIMEAAAVAQNYYKLQSYQLSSICAATGNASRNYPLVIQGKELYPQR
jgi:hypothetical protein